jgi:hypothetical protein
MRALQYSRFRENFLDRHLGPAGLSDALVRHRGLYSANYLSEWLHLFGKPPGPDELSEAMIEGWIAVPVGELADLDPRVGSKP